MRLLLPRMVEVRQKFNAPQVADYVSAIREELERAGLKEKISPSTRIAITAGSRGIAHYPEILATIVKSVKEAGGKPFLVPAMGGHGGATPEGQIKVLESLGITLKPLVHQSMPPWRFGR